MQRTEKRMQRTEKRMQQAEKRMERTTCTKMNRTQDTNL